MHRQRLSDLSRADAGLTDRMWILSNPEEERLLNTEEYQQKVGVCDFLRNNGLFWSGISRER